MPPNPLKNWGFLLIAARRKVTVNIGSLVRVQLGEPYQEKPVRNDRLFHFRVIQDDRSPPPCPPYGMSV